MLMGLTWTGPTAEDAGQGTTYVTKISVPRLGDDGVQRLHSHMKDPGPEPAPAAGPEPEPEAEAGR